MDPVGLEQGKSRARAGLEQSRATYSLVVLSQRKPPLETAQLHLDRGVVTGEEEWVGLHTTHNSSRTNIH